MFDPVPADALQFMHLRHTAVCRLAEANVELLQVASVTGHTPESVQRIVRHYFVRTGRVSEEAFRRRLEHESRG